MQHNIGKIVIKQCLSIFYPEEGKPFVVIDDNFKALIVDEGEEARVSQLICGYRQFLQGHGHCAHNCG